MDHVGVIEGADVDFHAPNEAACVECGAMVNLDSVIRVAMVDHDGATYEQEMTEANARNLLGELGIMPPPVMCNKHERLE